MKELFAEIPDPDVVLALEPEELGGKLLFLIKRRLNRENQQQFHPRNLIGEVASPGDRSRGTGGYPSDKWVNLTAAVSEAFAWLESQVLILPNSSDLSAGWRVLSRRAHAMDTDSDFQVYREAQRIPRELLHPDFREEVWLAFVRGDFSDAVFKAMRAVEIAVRDAAGFQAGDHGVPMIRRAFGKDGALRDSSAQEAEAEALQHLFAGAVGSYKNPHSHRKVAIDADEAIEVVILASHLMRIVFSRRSEQEDES